MDPELQELIEAWKNAGPNPHYHRQMKMRLAKEWPRLHNAVEALVKKHEGRN